MMLRKAVTGLAAVLAFGAVSAASALDLSAGVGGVFATDFGGQGLKVEGTGAASGNKMVSTLPWLGGGFNLFFDATYAEVGLGLGFVGGNPYQEYKAGDEDTSYTNKDVNISATLLNIGLLGKYPISLGDNMTIYPAVGIDYALCIAGQEKYTYEGGETIVKWDGKKDEYGEENPKAGDHSHLWVKFGVGYDHGFTDAIFLRAQALYGIGFASKVISDQVKEFDDVEYADASAALSHGLTIKVGVGYKF